MAYFPSGIVNYLQRTTGLLDLTQPLTVMFWVRLRSAVAGNYRSYFVTVDDPGIYAAYGFIGSDSDDDNSYLSISATESDRIALALQTWLHLTWVMNGTTHTFFRNAVAATPITADLSALVPGFELVGSDSWAEADIDIAYLRQWAAALSPSEIAEERLRVTARRTANLWLDTPLVANANDVSGNARHWTEVGTVTYSASAVPFLSIERSESVSVAEARTLQLLGQPLNIFASEDIGVGDVLDIPGQAGDAEIGQVRLVCGPHAITIDHPQWGFSKDVLYREQLEGVTPYGVFHRRAQGIVMRGYNQLRFPRIDSTIEAFRALSHYAGRTGERVYVVLDLGNTSIWWWVDWQPMIGFKRIIENREEIVLTLQRQSEGL